MAASSSKGQTFQIGDLVWARMKGFPPWPGRVSEPTKEMKKTPKKTSNLCVYFFGSNNYGWIETVNIKPYLPFKDDLTKTCKTAAFKEACAAIEDFRSKGENSLPTESSNPEEDAFDKLISPVSTPKLTKVKSKKSETPSSEDKKDDSDKKPRKSVEKKAVSAKKSERMTASKRASVPSVNGETPKKKFKRDDRDSDETESRSLMENHNVDRLVKTTYKSSSPSRNSFEADGVSSSSLANVSQGVETISQTLRDKNIKASDCKFGFIGLGIMGSGIVKNLINSGHKVVVWNRTSEKVQKFIDAGAEVGGSPYDVVKAADVIFSCVAGPSIAKLCVFGPKGVVNAIDETKCYIELTSIDAETSMDIADAICSKGGHYLEAQLQGSKHEAEEGKLLILCAGDRYVYDKCQSCFEAFGNASYFLGDAGTAAKMNLVIQLISGVTLGALAEGMALADRVGLQQADVLEILALTSLNCPLIVDKARSIIESYFSSCLPLKHLQKDLSLSLSLGDLLEHPLPLTAAANEVYKHARRIGYADHDASAVYLRAKF